MGWPFSALAAFCNCENKCQEKCSTEGSGWWSLLAFCWQFLTSHQLDFLVLVPNFREKCGGVKVRAKRKTRVLFDSANKDCSHYQDR